MDLLIEKGDKRTYLSRYKVITTSFEESSPSVKRNNTQIQYRNGNVDFGGWNESKTIDYVGYYRADDLEDEEYIRERIYALLSDPEGYYITQLKNDNDNSFERPGETSGDYFDKQVNRPSHKRFYVYASSLESELVGSYGGHVLYKISAKFTTMKLPYGESVPRDLDIKPITGNSAVGTNLLLGTYNQFSMTGNNMPGQWQKMYALSRRLEAGTTLTLSFDAVSTDFANFIIQDIGLDGGSWLYHINTTVDTTKKHYVVTNKLNTFSQLGIAPRLDNVPSTTTITFSNVKLELGSHESDWCPNPEDPEYNAWYTKIYYNTENLVIPYAGTVPCSQLEQGFTIEFTAKEAGSRLSIDVNGTELTYNGQISHGDVFKLSGYEYTKNGISIVKYTSKAYFKLIPVITNEISSNLHGSIKISGFQDLYA